MIPVVHKNAKLKLALVEPTGAPLTLENDATVMP